MPRFLGNPKFQEFANDGTLLAGGKVYTYDPGTTDNRATYPTIADAEASTNALDNPVILDSRGEATIVISGTTKIVVTDSDDNTIYTEDNISDNSISTLVDDNGNEVLSFTGVASAVNEVTITNAATGSAPEISATGDDTNVGLNLQAKGTGTVNVLGTASAQAELRLFEDTDNGTNYIGLKPPASVSTSLSLVLPSADGSNGDALVTDGSGNLSFSTIAGGKLLQEQYTTYTTYSSHTTALPLDDTIPQNTEGEEIMTASITPDDTSNILIIDALVYATSSVDRGGIALFQDSTASALACGFNTFDDSTAPNQLVLTYRMTAGTTSATTFKIRVGSNSGTLYANGSSSSRLGGGTLISSLRVREYSS